MLLLFLLSLYILMLVLLAGRKPISLWWGKGLGMTLFLSGGLYFLVQAGVKADENLAQGVDFFIAFLCGVGFALTLTLLLRSLR